MLSSLQLKNNLIDFVESKNLTKSDAVDAVDLLTNKFDVSLKDINGSLLRVQGQANNDIFEMMTQHFDEYKNNKTAIEYLNGMIWTGECEMWDFADPEWNPLAEDLDYYPDDEQFYSASKKLMDSAYLAQIAYIADQLKQNKIVLKDSSVDLGWDSPEAKEIYNLPFTNINLLNTESNNESEVA